MSEARWVKVKAAADLPPGSAHEIRMLTHSIAVFNCSGRYWAVDGRCKHMRARLARGKLDGVHLTCPWHGWTYDLTDGACLTEGEEWACLATFAVKEEGGMLFVDVAALDSESATHGTNSA
jgi:nitrite reductase/ring-hydroxylating ferredoxin subunit